jgi:tetratricopeptide (TPR) repeat protein
MTDYYDLGDHGRPVSTTSPDAQLWFDRGLIWTYAFNHEEAVRCFERAIEHDADCAMASWGVAYASGPNYNKPWEAFDQIDLSQTVSKTHAATAEALARSANATPAEQALIGALEARYPHRNHPRTTRSGTPPTPTRCGRCIGTTATTSTSRRSSPTPS